MSLGLQAQAQTASPAPPGSAPAPSQAAPKGGINALLDSVRTSGDDFLPPDRAFRFDALPDGTDRVRLNWEIADGYYLYRARIRVVTPSTRAQLGTPQMPQGQIKTDEYFGRQEVYHHELVATVPVVRPTGGAFELPLQVTYQGCADAGLCYPPITKDVTVNLPAGAASPVSGSPGSSALSGHPGAAVDGVAEQDWFASLIRSGNPLVMLGWFYLAGLVLAFTPCVLPMVPILSGIIAGGGRSVTTTRAVALSVTYVLGMALTYTLAGIARPCSSSGGCWHCLRHCSSCSRSRCLACSPCRCQSRSRPALPTSATASPPAPSAEWPSWGHSRLSSSPPAWDRRSWERCS